MDTRKEAILKHRVFKKPGKRFQVFFICLFLSAFIWFTREITKEGNDLILFPIEITDLSNDLIVSSGFPKELEVKISSQGLNRLKSEWYKKNDPISIDLSSLEKAGVISINSRKLTSLVKEKIGNNATIISIDPSNLQIHLEKIASKKVSIVPNIDLNFSVGYFLDEQIFCHPDSVTLFGIQSSLDSISDVTTAHIILENLNASDTTSSRIIPINNIKMDLDETNIIINVDELTEGVIYKKLHQQINEKNETLTFYPDSVKITFQVGLNKYEEVNTNDFIIEAKILLQNNGNKVPVSLIKFPDYIQNTRINPKRVEYYISK